MARLPRLCVPGWPHLLLQTGHNRQPVFLDDADRTLFLGLLRESAAAAGVTVHAYGLFDSEVRLLGTPGTSDGLSRMMQAVGRRYGTSFNRRHARSGSLWEGRFRATVVEPEQHLLACMLYAEGMTQGGDSGTQLGRGSWSSAPHRLGERVDPLVADHLRYWSLGNTPFDREAGYRAMCQRGLTRKEVDAITEAVSKGWPLGSSKDFKVRLTELTDRRIEPLRRGRPPKSAHQSDPN